MTSNPYVDPSELESTYLDKKEGLKRGEKTERQDLVTGNLEITFRGKYNLEVLPASVADIEGLLVNVLKRDAEHDEQEADKVHHRIEATDGFTKSDEEATEDIEAADSPNDQIVLEDDHRVRDLFLDLVNQLDVFPNQHQKRLRKLTESGRQYVYSEFVTSFKNSDQNPLYDNVSDHWVTEQNCYVVSADTAEQITKTFDGLGDSGRYDYQFGGERNDVLILNLNGIKAAFIIDARAAFENKLTGMPAANDNQENVAANNDVEADETAKAA